MKFFLGSHVPVWLSRHEVPLLISRRKLVEYKVPPVARCGWALDSGGFSELQMYGRWETPAMQYATEVRRWQERVGKLEWAAIQDWMCEPMVRQGGKVGPIVFKGTRLSVREHQRMTIHSWHLLRRLAPDMPWVPVVQGWEPDEYLEHVEMYRESGTDLTKLPLVGVGSVCKRQATEEALAVLRPLHGMGLKLHGFGFKIDGLWNGAAALLESADSMAWSRAARYEPPLPGCTHKTCSNCWRFASAWRERVLAAVERGIREYQGVLFA